MNKPKRYYECEYDLTLDFDFVKKYVTLSVEYLNKKYKEFMIDQVDSVIITRNSIELVIFDLKDVYEIKDSELTIKETKGRSMVFDILKVKNGVFRIVEIVTGSVMILTFISMMV